jgi:hypothetical protein
MLRPVRHIKTYDYFAVDERDWGSHEAELL